MKNGLVKRIITGAILPFILSTAIGCEDPIPVNIETIKIVMGEDMRERQVILDSADRILELQNVNGSWDWNVTGADGPTATTYLNIAGVTGELLIDAYKLTGNNKYLDGAKLAGDYLKSEIGVPSSTQKQNAFNVVFLYNLNKATNDVSYKDEADAIVNHLLHEDNYWTTAPHDFDNDGITGLNAEELLNVVKDYRKAYSDPNGIVVYDLFHFIEAAKEAGETGFANDTGNIINNYLKQSSYNNTIDAYDLGLATGIMGLKNAGINYGSFLTKLIDNQNADGSFSECPIQDTAYGLMAFVCAGAEEAKKKASQYLADNFRYKDTGIQYNGWLEGDGLEYSEVTSEAGQALYQNHIK